MYLKAYMCGTNIYALSIEGCVYIKHKTWNEKMKRIPVEVSVTINHQKTGGFSDPFSLNFFVFTITFLRKSAKSFAGVYFRYFIFSWNPYARFLMIRCWLEHGIRYSCITGMEIRDSYEHFAAAHTVLLVMHVIVVIVPVRGIDISTARDCLHAQQQL